MKNVITVIVTYNRKHILRESLQALDNCNGDNLVLIVDNGCTDGTKEAILDYLEKKDKFRYYRIEQNEGATNGFNLGIREAIRIGCSYVWIMDDDCIVNSDSLEKLLEADKTLQGEYGFLSSRVNWKDNNPCIMNIQKKSFVRRVKNFNKNYQKIILASFVSLFIKSNVIKEIGLPIKEFYIWTDDWEYTRRISKKYKSYYISNSIVTHNTPRNVGASIENISSERLDRCRYLFRNDYYLYRREGVKGKLYFWSRIVYHKLKICFSKIKDKKNRIKIMNCAIKEGKKFYPSIEYPFEAYDKLKVLILFAEPFAYGGQEAYMINMFSHYKDSNEYTFATPFSFTNTRLKDMVLEKKAKIIALNYSFHKLVRKINISKAIKKILREKYDVVHIQSSSCFALSLLAKECKKRGVNKVIIHSHCGGRETLSYRIAKKYSDRNNLKYVDKYLACSLEAAKWKFPQEIITQEKWKKLNNGINLDIFEFNENDRMEIRKLFKIENNTLLLCHVGRFEPEKNHKFFLELIPILYENKIDFKFIFVGAGSLKNEFMKEVDALSINKSFIFLENIDYVNKIMSASDIFVLPSISEGFPMVLVEAQANGLYSIFSDQISDECLLTEASIRLPLDPKIWYSQIMKCFFQNNDNRNQYFLKVKNKGYDAKDCASVLEKIYVE